MVSLDGGLQANSMTSYRQDGGYALPWQRYDNNKWRLYVGRETLWQQQDGGYALLCSTSSTVQS